MPVVVEKVRRASIVIADSRGQQRKKKVVLCYGDDFVVRWRRIDHGSLRRMSGGGALIRARWLDRFSWQRTRTSERGRVLSP